MGMEDRIQEARSARMQDMVKWCLSKAALAVMAESDQTTNHADRVIYAKKVLDGSASIFEVCVGVTTNSSIAAKIDANQDYESDLEFTVNSMFDSFAG